MNLNKAELIGNLTADPESKTLRSGTEVANFAVATSYRWKDGSKEPKHEVEYHPVVAYGQLGKVVLKYLKKGDKVYIDGRLKTPRWRANGRVRSGRTIVIATNLIMLGSCKRESEGNDDVVESEIDVGGGEG